MKTIFMGLLCMLLVAMNIHAADTASSITTSSAISDGRTFDSLSPDDLPHLSASDQAAYQRWQAAHPAETSTYQQAPGPNTMDISSDFSM